MELYYTISITSTVIVINKVYISIFIVKQEPLSMILLCFPLFYLSFCSRYTFKSLWSSFLQFDFPRISFIFLLIYLVDFFVYKPFFSGLICFWVFPSFICCVFYVDCSIVETIFLVFDFWVGCVGRGTQPHMPRIKPSCIVNTPPLQLI